jgi:hypothetical protein
MSTDDHADWSALEIDEIAELLEELGANLSTDQLLATAQFVKDAGSLENALNLMQLMQERRAA